MGITRLFFNNCTKYSLMAVMCQKFPALPTFRLGHGKCECVTKWTKKNNQPQ